MSDASAASATPTQTPSAPTSTAGWVRRLWGYMLRHRANLILALTAALMGSLCQTLVPLIARQIVDNVIVRHTSPLWPWLLLLIGVAVVTFGFTYLRRYRGGRVALQVQYDLRNDMHDHLQTMDLDNLNRMSTGQLVSRANSDSTLVQGLLNFFPIVSGNVLLMVLSLITMLFLSPLLGIVSFLVAPALLVLSYRMRRMVFPATWDGQQREGDIAQIVDEDVSGVRVVKAFGQEQRELQRIVGASKRLYGSHLRAVRLQARYQPLLEAVPSIGQVAILALGGWLVIRHQLTVGTFLAFSTYVAQFAAPARQLAGILTIGQAARAGVERIFQLLDLQPAIADAPEAVDLAPITGEIRFEDVVFGYSDEAPLLDGFDLTIAPGERVAIVGPSGSGKSTVAMLLARFYDPRSGSIWVDGTDVRSVTLRSLRKQIGFAFEDSFLFSESVSANIGYARPGATFDAIRKAAIAAQADEFISELPRGYDTPIGERGLTLSGGQRQRIALARAILADPAVLVLDDATSAVDSRIEEAIHDGLRDVLAGRTTLLIAHRRSTLHLADRIVVLHEGRIVDQGSHDDLFDRSSIYRRLLTGFEEQQAQKVGDRIEALSTLTPSGTTAAAWSSADPSSTGPRIQNRTVGAPSIGPGLGGSGGGWRLNLAATPELLARVAALPPVRDSAAVDVAAESVQDRQFSLRKLVREFRRPLMFGLLFVVIDAVAGLFGPVLVKSGIDNGAAVGSTAVLFLASGVYLVITLADMFDQVVQTFVMGRIAERVMLSLRVRIWAQMQRLSLDYYEREMGGRIMTRMTTDVDQFESLIENGLLSALVSFVTFAGVGVALLVINLDLGLATLVVAIPLAIATVIFRRKAARLYDLARERIAIVNADFQESLSGIRESQAFAREPETREHFHRLGRDYLDSRVAAQRLVSVYFPFVQFLSAVADAIVLGVGAALIAHGHITAGTLIAFILYIDLFFSPIQQLSQVFDAWQQTRVSVNRISDLMQLETLTPQPDRPSVISGFRGQLDLTDVRFSYPAVPSRPGAARKELRGPADARLLGAGDARVPPPEALRGVDLHIDAGETVAIVGQTGAGKSTVMKLLARFYDPDSGSVRIDGQDLRNLDLESFRRCLGYVPQEGFLFSGTIRDNIAYGRPEATDADVEAAGRAVGAHDFIAHLPGGYRHELSERGRSLSAGQRQLIALARAELVDPAVLLLDEATSNLDLATEARVSAAMDRVAHGRTTILIAHRLQTARTADRIVVLHAGRVDEVGSHSELLERGGRYAAMWQAFETMGRADSEAAVPRA